MNKAIVVRPDAAAHPQESPFVAKTKSPEPFTLVLFGATGILQGEDEAAFMNVLAIDVAETHVKILATGHEKSRKFPSGPTMTPKQMVAGAKKLAGEWKCDAISIG